MWRTPRTVSARTSGGASSRTTPARTSANPRQRLHRVGDHAQVRHPGGVVFGGIGSVTHDEERSPGWSAIDGEHAFRKHACNFGRRIHGGGQSEQHS